MPAIAADEQPQAKNYPIASDARLAGDARQTRFVLDLDRTVAFRAFTLADPYRLVVDIPQVSFRLPAGTGTNGRGLVKAFRYGLVMPGGSRIVFDLTGPVKITNSTMLAAANDQPPRLVLELEETDAASFRQALAAKAAPELKPSFATNAVVSAPQVAPAASRPAAQVDTLPVVVIDPGHGGVDNGTRAGEETEKSLVLAFGLALREQLERRGKCRVV